MTLQSAFIYSVLLNPHNNLVRVVIILLPEIRKENRYSEVQGLA